MRTQVSTFTSKLGQLKNEIDTALALHAKVLRQDAVKNYTPYSVAVLDAYLGVLNRGGKRIRGALTIVGYEMCGGTKRAMAVEAAAAIEMVHAYILLLDDIMDRSAVRRGGPSAHSALSEYHKKHNLAGDGVHFGEAVAINGALIGDHYAQALVAGLDVEPEYKIKALQLLNEALVVTGHGQINDIFNEVVERVDELSVDRVLEWKTAYYTFLNPLQFGMALAGASQATLDAIYNFCMYAGRAFQITDDILGIFGTELAAGKSPMDDIREGKRTVLTVAALQKARSSDKNFLIQMLGNEHLTKAQFERCKEIIVTCGALDTANKRAKETIAQALVALDANKVMWSVEGTDFLQSLAKQLLGRTA